MKQFVDPDPVYQAVKVRLPAGQVGTAPRLEITLRKYADCGSDEQMEGSDLEATKRKPSPGVGENRRYSDSPEPSSQP